MVCPDRCLYRAELLLQLLAPGGRGRGRGTYSVPTQFCLMRKFPQHLHSFKSEGSQFSQMFSPKLQLLPLRRSRGHCLAPYKVILQQSRMRMAVARGSGTGRRRRRNRTDNRCGCGRVTVWTPLPPPPPVPPLRISRFRNGSPILLGADPLVLMCIV